MDPSVIQAALAATLPEGIDVQTYMSMLHAQLPEGMDLPTYIQQLQLQAAQEEPEAEVVQAEAAQPEGVQSIEEQVEAPPADTKAPSGQMQDDLTDQGRGSLVDEETEGRVRRRARESKWDTPPPPGSIISGRAMPLTDDFGRPISVQMKSDFVRQGITPGGRPPSGQMASDFHSQGGGGGKPGDWICAACQNINFAKRRECKKCHASAAGAERIGLKPGDWICPGCGDLVFASRPQCKMCSTPNPNPTKGKGKGKKKSDDVPSGPLNWHCPKCQYCQPTKVTECRQCGEAQPPINEIIAALEAKGEGKSSSSRQCNWEYQRVTLADGSGGRTTPY
jgi:hypothetical protein